VDDPIPETEVGRADLPKRARYKCNICGAYGLNKPLECSGFGGEPGDDSRAHSPLMMIPNPDRTDWS
jgi:hypothetical protein